MNKFKKKTINVLKKINETLPQKKYYLAPEWPENVIEVRLYSIWSIIPFAEFL